MSLRYREWQNIKVEDGHERIDRAHAQSDIKFAPGTARVPTACSADLNVRPFLAARGRPLRALRCAAIAALLVQPKASMARIIASTLAANCSALALRAFATRLTQRFGFRVPDFFPLALTAASAALIRSEIILRASRAALARSWIVRLLIWGLSTAMKSTSESISVTMKARLRESLSNFAIINRARSLRQVASAFTSSGRLVARGIQSQ